jgi:hypothetical protein
MTSTLPVSLERRIGQRFPFNLPVALRELATGAAGLGFTQDVSSRGAFFFTDMAITAGADIELTLKMPAEITLGETMRVRCTGRVLRLIKPLESSCSETKSSEAKIGVAVCLTGYEYLPESEDSSPDFRRVSALHGSSEVERPVMAGDPATRNIAH